MYENCCFTGHRELPRGEALLALERKTREAILAAYRAGVRQFYAGGALGFDTLAAEAVCDLRDGDFPDICLHLLLPCHGQEKYWKPEEQAIYFQMIERADSHSFLYPHYTRFVMAARNRALVEAAELCIAYLNKPTGGTAQTVKLAQKKQIRIINLGEAPIEACN